MASVGLVLEREERSVAIRYRIRLDTAFIANSYYRC